MAAHCPDCLGRLDRPAIRACTIGRGIHPLPDLAERIVAAIEAECNRRNGLQWSPASPDTLVEIRDTAARLVRRELRGADPAAESLAADLLADALDESAERKAELAGDPRLDRQLGRVSAARRLSVWAELDRAAARQLRATAAAAHARTP